MTNHTISAVFFQTQPRTDVPRACIVCNIQSCEEKMAAGPYDAAGRLTFICNSHLRNSHQFIGQLADFIADERQRALKYSYTLPVKSFTKAEPDAWFLY